MDITKKRLLPGDRIKALRLEKGLSQDELANRTEAILQKTAPEDSFSQAAYNRWENNKIVAWKLSIMEAIAQVLGTTPEYLLGTTDQLSQFSEPIKEWLTRPESVEYVQEAFVRFIRKEPPR